jgi:hypothetical protein
MPRRDPKCGTSIITGLEESSYTKMVYFICHRKTQTMYYIILKQKFFLFVVVIHTHPCTHMYKKTYTGKLPSPGSIADASDKKNYIKFCKVTISATLY